MPTPKRKVSKARRDKRSANKGVKPKTVAVCQTCQAPTMPHCVCKECGYYKGTKIVRTKTDRMYDRGQARQAKQAKQKEMLDATAMPETTDTHNKEQK